MTGRDIELEADILRNALKMLKFYKDVPMKGSKQEEQFWENVTNDMVKYAEHYDNHPLAIETGNAVFCYFEHLAGYKKEYDRE